MFSFSSIKTKLTLWYTLILCGTLFLFGMIAFFSAETQLFRNLDLSLRNEVLWLKNFIEPKAKKIRLKKHRALQSKQEADSILLAKKVSRIKEEFIVEDDTTEFDVIWNQIYQHTLLSPKKQLIQIEDRNGDLLYKSYSLGEETLYFEAVPINTTKLVTIYDKTGKPLRLAVYQSKYAKIFVAYPETDVYEIINSLFSILLLLIPVVILVSILGGYFLANRSLAPVENINKTARNITALNLNERLQKNKVDDEIGRLIETINEMFDRLQQSFELMKQFSADASHELRTPLTIIRGEIELALSSKQSSEEYQRILASILEETVRLSTITDGLLTLAQSERSDQLHLKEAVPLHNIINELFEDISLIASAKEIKLTKKQIDTINILGDSIRLRQLFLNILDNAIKYTQPKGEVAISLLKNGTMAEFIVQDSGIGVAIEDHQKIFDRFYRVDKGRSRSLGGTGLGLSIAKWITESHNGKISVQSEIGKGSTFTITIPSVKK
ncbi:MAG: HAMP domain-containing sensor histidine kinase [Bacteroidetes bacterium]|nr:HAMP domain-containing sensor histidine kinase [Bacteroidota bacterium]